MSAPQHAAPERFSALFQRISTQLYWCPFVDIVSARDGLAALREGHPPDTAANSEQSGALFSAGAFNVAWEKTVLGAGHVRRGAGVRVAHPLRRAGYSAEELLNGIVRRHRVASWQSSSSVCVPAQECTAHNGTPVRAPLCTSNGRECSEGDEQEEAKAREELARKEVRSVPAASCVATLSASACEHCMHCKPKTWDMAAQNEKPPPITRLPSFRAADPRMLELLYNVHFSSCASYEMLLRSTATTLENVSHSFAYQGRRYCAEIVQRTPANCLSFGATRLFCTKANGSREEIFTQVGLEVSLKAEDRYHLDSSTPGSGRPPQLGAAGIVNVRQKRENNATLEGSFMVGSDLRCLSTITWSGGEQAGNSVSTMLSLRWDRLLRASPQELSRVAQLSISTRRRVDDTSASCLALSVHLDFAWACMCRIVSERWTFVLGMSSRGFHANSTSQDGVALGLQILPSAIFAKISVG